MVLLIPPDGQKIFDRSPTDCAKESPMKHETTDYYQEQLVLCMMDDSTSIFIPTKLIKALTEKYKIF